MTKIIEIRVGEMAVGKNDTVIKTMGIGSCLAVCMFDKEAKIGGMAHAMLPSRRHEAGGSVTVAKEDPSAKYVDDSINLLFREILKFGGDISGIEAKLVGGAHMFKSFSEEGCGVGCRNIEMARKKLGELGIPITNEETGGSIGRTAVFNVMNCVLDVNIKM